MSDPAIEPTLADVVAPLPAVTPNHGFMIDAEGNRILSVYKTPRVCIRCGETFIPQKRSNGMASNPEVCSYTCRLKKASKQLGAISAESRIDREIAYTKPAPIRSNSAPIPTGPIPTKPPRLRPSKQPRGGDGRFARKDAATPPTPFAHALRRMRQRLDLRASDVAEELGVAPTTVFNWERGDVMIPADKLASLADFFGVSMEDLWHGRV